MYDEYDENFGTGDMLADFEPLNKETVQINGQRAAHNQLRRKKPPNPNQRKGHKQGGFGLTELRRVFMNFDYQALFQKFLTAFSFALGVAAAKWLCAMIPLRGFNLNF